MQQMIFIADLSVCSTCFGHHYAHNQELESIIQVVAACGIWCFGFQVVGMVWSWGTVYCCSDIQPDNYTDLSHIQVIRKQKLIIKFKTALAVPLTATQKFENQSTKYHRQQPPV